MISLQDYITQTLNEITLGVSKAEGDGNHNFHIDKLVPGIVQEGAKVNFEVNLSAQEGTDNGTKSSAILGVVSGLISGGVKGGTEKFEKQSTNLINKVSFTVRITEKP